MRSYAAARRAGPKRVGKARAPRHALVFLAAVALCAFGGATGAAAPAGLVAAYSFNEGLGTAVADSSGNGNNGSITGALWSTTGKFGKSLSFSPSRTSSVSIPNSASLQLSALTLEAWVNPAAVSGTWRTVVFKERPGGMTYALYAGYDANRPLGQVFTTAEQNAVGTAAVPLNAWTHLAMTYGGGALKLYVNGTQTASVALSASVVASTGLLKIGGNAVFGEWFDGLIDEVRVYNRALTAAEIQTDMTTPVGATDTTPPSAPGALTATTGGVGQVALSWGAATDNVGVTRYNVHRSTTAGFTPSAANRIAQPTGTSYADSGLAPGTYYYKVTAEDAAGNVGPASNESSAAAGGDTTPPSAPGTLTATGSAGQVALSWGAATDASGIARYNLYRAVSSGFTPTPGNLVAQPAGTSYTDSGLTPGVYYYKVTATDGAGNSGPASNEASASVSSAPSGLVAAYAFDQGAGATAADQSGNGNTGTLTNATWAGASAGKFGNALSFNGTNASVSVADASSIDLMTGMTLEGWVKPNAAGGYATLIVKEQPGNLVYGLYSNTDANRPEAQVTVGGSPRPLSGTGTVPTGIWTHLAATYDGTTLRLYVNGVLASTLAVSGTIATSSAPLKIGGNSIWSEWFNGLIDEVRVYNRPLTAAEITTDMNTSISAPDTTPPSAPGTLTATGGLGQISLAWGAATDNIAVAKYDVYRSTTAGFTPSVANRIAQPTGTSYTDSGLAAGTYYYKITAEDAAANIGPASNEANAAAGSDTTPPTAAITAPAAGATISATVNVTASASDNGTVAGVQFKLDGASLGAEDTTTPYSVSWDTTTASNGNHSLVAVARDGAGNLGPSSSVGVNVQNQSPPNFAADTLVTGLDQPTQILFTPDGRMLILQRAGTVLVVQPGANQPDPTPFLQLSTVNMSDERGALGLVLDPGFASNGFFYVMYTHSSLLNRVSRFTAVGNSASVSSESVVWQNDEQAAIYHQGGGLAFGPDGKLYISVGDNLNRASAQSLSSFNGKILRLNSDGSVPADNPFVDGAGPNYDAIWALGLRNPFRFTFDSLTGRMIIADVGEGSWEEVNIGIKGANYGWPTCEGVCGAPGLTDPIFTYPHNGRDASITGGFVYHGNQFGPAFDGSYFYGDYAQNVIRRLTFDGAGAVSGDLPFLPADGSVDGPYGDPVDIRQGPDGSLYYVDIGPLTVQSSGTVRRVRNLNGNLPPTATSSASPTSGAAPLAVAFSSAGSSDPEGAQLSYLWAFGDGTTSIEANPSHTYGVNGVYTARLNVSDGVNTSFAAPIQITVGGAPVATITAPVDGAMFQAAQTINLAGSATDPQDGQLSGSSLKWTVVFHHETHEHPGPGPFFGSSASFTTPSSGHDFTGNTSYEIVLTATDSSGISSSTSVFVYPRKVNMTFDSVPAGMTLLVDSLAHTTPYTVDTLVGFQHTVEAPSPQALGGTSYTFTSWSDGGARVHAVSVPVANATLTATYSTFSGPRPGLVAAYNFNEGAGTTVADASGNGNVGSITSATWTTAGKYGAALSFNGTSARVNVPDANSLDLTTGMTLEAWVNPTGASGAWRTVIFKERPGGMLYSLYANNGGANRPLGQVFLANAEQNAAGTAAVPLNTWTHLATTYDGSALRLYVNGSLVSTVAVSGTLANTANPLRIGGNAIWNEYFRGLIDDVRVYNRALTPSEIGSDMTTPVAGP